RRRRLAFRPSARKNAEPWRVRSPRMSRTARGSLLRLSRRFRARRALRHQAGTVKKSRGARRACRRSEWQGGNAGGSPGKRFLLGGIERPDSTDRQLQKLVELRAVEGAVLACSLHLDELAFAAHHD